MLSKHGATLNCAAALLTIDKLCETHRLAIVKAKLFNGTRVYYSAGVGWDRNAGRTVTSPLVYELLSASSC